MTPITNRIAHALYRMILEYGGSAEIDAINPRMRNARDEAIAALQEAGYCDERGSLIKKVH